MGVTLSERQKVRPAHLKEMQNAYDWIIDASGGPSVTSRNYGFSNDYFPGALIAYQAVLSGDFSRLAPAIKAVFLPDLPKEAVPGYYWVFPKDHDRANVGVVCTAGYNGRLSLNLKELLREVFNREGLRHCAVAREGGGMIPTRILPRLVYDNILLVGRCSRTRLPPSRWRHRYGLLKRHFGGKGSWGRKGGAKPLSPGNYLILFKKNCPWKSL